MASQNIELSDLIEHRKDTDKEINATYSVLQDEIADFLEKPKKIEKSRKSLFFSQVPTTDLKKSLDKVFKLKNAHEERVRKHLQFDFDKKMQRINKIKSKTYRRLRRRDKIRAEQALEESAHDSSQEEHSSKEGEEEIEHFRPVLQFENGIDGKYAEEENINRELVASAFGSLEEVETKNEFFIEKKEIVESEAPQIIETVLPGWGSWTGEGLPVIKTKYNTVVEMKDGVKYKDRKDYKKPNVIINENLTIPDKYKAAVPYGYNKKEYKDVLATPVSRETTSVKVFNRFVKMAAPESSHPEGKKIEPATFDP